MFVLASEGTQVKSGTPYALRRLGWDVIREQAGCVTVADHVLVVLLKMLVFLHSFALFTTPISVPVLFGTICTNSADVHFVPHINCSDDWKSAMLALRVSPAAQRNHTVYSGGPLMRGAAKLTSKLFVFNLLSFVLCLRISLSSSSLVCVLGFLSFRKSKIS